MSAKDRKLQRKSPQQQAGQSPAGPQQKSGAGGQYGEGNYKATRDYDRGLKEHLRTHDVEREARDAAPRSEDEARQMREAEEAGRSKARDASVNDGSRKDRIK